ncbi:MAG: hypothetical protein IT327_02780 [Anaerolineae bacterium]|nr:hypothetical protein [Anaerolineae bacterium]
MLWLDDDKQRPLAEKVQRAVEYYQQKYGTVPTTCLVNSSAVAAETAVAGVKVKVKGSTTVLPYHFWLGQEEANAH